MPGGTHSKRASLKVNLPIFGRGVARSLNAGRKIKQTVAAHQSGVDADREREAMDWILVNFFEDRKPRR